MMVVMMRERGKEREERRGVGGGVRRWEDIAERGNEYCHVFLFCFFAVCACVLLCGMKEKVRIINDSGRKVAAGE